MRRLREHGVTLIACALMAAAFVPAGADAGGRVEPSAGRRLVAGASQMRNPTEFPDALGPTVLAVVEADKAAPNPTVPPEPQRLPISPNGPDSGIDREAWIGDKAPDFTLDGSRGRPVRLTDLKGHWAVLVFAEDRAPLDSLRGIDSELKPLGVRLYGVCEDGASELKSNAEHDRLSFVLLSDPTRQISQIYGMYDAENDTIRPGIVLLDPEGVVRMTLFGQALHSIEIVQLVKHAVIGA